MHTAIKKIEKNIYVAFDINGAKIIIPGNIKWCEENVPYYLSHSGNGKYGNAIIDVNQNDIDY